MRLLSNALVNKKKKMEKLKTKILLEVIEDIIIKYPNTYDFTQQKLNEKCDREGILTDKVCFFFFNMSRSKRSKLYIKISICY